MIIEKIANRLQKESFILIAVLVCFTANLAISRLAGDNSEDYWVPVLVVGEAGAIGLLAYWMEHRFRRQLRAMASIITKRDYAQLLKTWNESGPGFVLLYNIELQSFETEEDIERTWGRLHELTNVQGIVLLLPRSKMARWEHIVLREEDRFFANDNNRRKFFVCELERVRIEDWKSGPIHAETDPHQSVNDIHRMEDADPGVGFALYRFGMTPDQGRLHKQAAVFVLAEPFSQSKPSFVVGDQRWWDYHHILKFTDDREILASAEHIWRRHYADNQRRDVNRVLADSKRLRPIEPRRLLEGLKAKRSRQEEILAHFSPRSRRVLEPKRIPMDRPDGTFSILYDNGESVEGHYTGIDSVKREPRKAMIWVGGFTERRATKLPGLFEKHLAKESVCQFYYEVSPPVEYITLTRYMQDMREVLRFINSQPSAVLPRQVVLVARSINALLGALVAAEDEFLPMLRGLILVAPVFDVVEMMDKYRAARGTGHVRVEKCWRLSPGYTADRWEDERNGWLEYFGHSVSLTLLCDIIRHDPHFFSLAALKNALGRITQECRVHVLSHSEDPVTGSAEAIRALTRAATGTGFIRQDNFRFVPIDSSHKPQVSKDEYPFVLRQEIRQTRQALREILTEVGIPTAASAEEAEPCKETEASGVFDPIVERLEESFSLPPNARGAIARKLRNVSPHKYSDVGETIKKLARLLDSSE